jgi:hypothetical protein
VAQASRRGTLGISPENEVSGSAAQAWASAAKASGRPDKGIFPSDKRNVRGKRGIRSLAELLAAALASPPSRNRAQQIFRNHHIREIQPWLQKISDLAQENGSQVMLISHHPEVIDYLAASSAFRFERPTGDVVRVRPFKVNRDSGLKASEALARGWDDESTPG